MFMRVIISSECASARVYTRHQIIYIEICCMGFVHLQQYASTGSCTYLNTVCLIDLHFVHYDFDIAWAGSEGIFLN